MINKIYKTVLQKYNLLIVMIFFLMQSCISYKPVDLKAIESVNFNGVSGGTASVNVVVRINNPNNYKIKIKKYDLHTFLNEKDMGAVNISDKIVFPKKSEQSYSLNISADISQLIGSLPGLLFTNTVLVGLKGELTVGAKIFSKKYPIDLKQTVSTKDIKL